MYGLLGGKMKVRTKEPKQGATQRLLRARNASSQRRGFFNASSEASSPWAGQDLTGRGRPLQKVRQKSAGGGGNDDQPRDERGRWT